MKFRDVHGHPDYMVSECGEVLSLKRKKLRLLTHSKDGWGYRVVGLTSNGVFKSFKAHRLIAEAFLGPCPAGYHVNHKNGNKMDNRVSNLEYVTPAQNTQHAYDTGLNEACRRPGEKHHNSKLSNVSASELLQLKGTMTQKAAAILFNLSREHVRDIWNGKKRKHLQSEASA